MALLLERNDCPVCGEVLHSRKELDSHLHAHRQALQSTCSVCQANTLTLDALLLHLSTVHSPRSLPVPGTITADTLFSQAILPASPYAHNPMSAIASLVSMAACQAGSSTPDPAAFLGSSGMASRMSSIMEQIITYRGMLPCPICQLLCSSKQHMAAHLTSVHAASSLGREGFLDDARSESQADSRQDSDAEGLNSASFFCFDCSMGFSSQAAYAQHCMLQHGTTSVVSQGSCSICHRAFDTWKDLHSHYLAAHGVTNFCDKCKMGFVSAAELKSHYESMHGSADARSMTFICDICNKGFYSQSQCSAHKRSHISEKSFACQVCGSAFFKRGDLSKHFRTVHAPNRVFSCRFCGKRGTRMDNMRSHVKSHGKHMTRDEILSFIEEVKS